MVHLCILYLWSGSNRLVKAYVRPTTLLFFIRLLNQISYPNLKTISIFRVKNATPILWFYFYGIKIPCASHCFPIFNISIDKDRAIMYIQSCLPAFFHNILRNFVPNTVQGIFLYFNDL